MRHFILAFFIVVLATQLFSCNNSTISKNAVVVEQLYARQEQFLSVNKDSILLYATKIEQASTGMPVEYQVMGMIGKATYHVTTKPSLALKLFTDALALLSNSTADTLKAKINNGIGVCYKKMGDYPAALDHFFKSLRLYEKENHQQGIGGALSNIGEVYQLKNDIPNAKQYIHQAIQINRENNNTTRYLAAMQTLANIYGMNNQFDSALAIDNLGIAISDSIHSPTLKSTFYNNKGNCYLYSNRPDSAAWYFKQCVLLDSADGNIMYMSDNYYTLGMLAYQQKEYGEAEKNFTYAIVLADSMQSNYLKADSWVQLAVLYKDQNKLDLAIAAKDSAAAVKDRLINEKTEARVAELKELFETEKKEQTIALQESKLSLQRLIIIGGTVLLAVLSLWAISWYRRHELKKEKELQQTLLHQREEATINILTAEEKERKRIAAELHDGVGQLMTAAWLNLQVMEKHKEHMQNEQQQLLNKTAQLVGESCNEVRQVSHNMMPNALQKKGLVNAIKEFTQQIDPSVISINLQAENLQAPLDSLTETILYRVIQECINNTIKHAAATELDISINNNDDGISVLIEDNGKGFDTGIINNEAEGLGLQNIRSRISFLKGTVHWDSSPGNGTVVAIHLPLQENERPKN